jgi:hypothetical protein
MLKFLQNLAVVTHVVMCGYLWGNGQPVVGVTFLLLLPLMLLDEEAVKKARREA